MVFITAEIGVNWDGDFALIEKMMKDAKNADCNAVKLQAFDEKIVSDHPEKNRLLKSSVSSDNIEQINSISKKVGIEWYCTPMYPNAIDFLDPFVKRDPIAIWCPSSTIAETKSGKDLKSVERSTSIYPTKSALLSIHAFRKALPLPF